MKNSLLKLSSLVLLLGCLTGCGGEANPGTIETNGVRLSTSAPSYQLADHSSNYIDDQYKNYYQILVYSFYDSGYKASSESSSSKIGDLQGLISKLDYINDGNPLSTTSLHYDGIYTLPIFPSPTYHKYDATDYYSIDPTYGTMSDFETLLSECKERGISVILDLAINHTSSQHSWFTTARQALSNLDISTDVDSVSGRIKDEVIEANPDLCWYNFTTNIDFNGYKCSDCHEYITSSDANEYKKDNELSVLTCPNCGHEFDSFDRLNHRSTKWTAIKDSLNRTWYFEEQFNGSGMPDLNLDNETVQNEIYNIMKFWLDKGVKGFRFDATSHFFDDNINKTYDFISKLRQWGDEICTDRDDPYYMVCEGPWGDSIINYYQNSSTHSMMNFYYGGAANRLTNLSNLAYKYSEAEETYGEENLILDDKLNITNEGTVESAATKFGRITTSWNSRMDSANPDSIDANFNVNHDTIRTMNQLSGTYYKTDTKAMGCKLTWMLNNTLRGNSFVYYGEEIGMNAGDQQSYADPNKRHPMYWSTTDTTGMTQYAPGASECTQYLAPADEQIADSSSLWNFMREINKMKTYFPEIARGTSEVVKSAKDYLVLKRTYNNNSIYLVYNFKYTPQSISVDELGLDDVPTEIKYSLTSDSSSYSLLTEGTLNVPGYSITVL